jgi:GT2 family glycosyltransferase
VVIPVRDQAPRLRLTLAALERQEGLSPDEYEVVVVDDGSRDGLDAVLAEVTARAPYRLSVLACASGGCRGVPRNVGARVARADVLLFLDADACPSRHLIAGHLRVQATAGDLLALGDYYVIAKSERLLDPERGIPFARFSSSPSKEVAWRLPIERLRAQGDAALERDAEKGGYPGMKEWQLQLEEMLSTGGAGFAWAGSVPHNLSVRRTTFTRLGGFNPSLRHAEGWDLGIRAQAHGCTIGWAPGARTYHLHHWRPMLTYAQGVRESLDFLCARYPDLGVEGVILWTESLNDNKRVPPELNLGNWRVVARRLATCGGRAALRELHGRVRDAERSRSAMDYLTARALNSPCSIAGAVEARSGTSDVAR